MSKKELIIKISNILNDLGIAANVRGYYYIRDAITIIVEKGNMQFTKELYPQLAKTYKTNGENIERNMRTAIQKAFLIGNKQSIDNMFKHTINRKTDMVTNRQFVNTIADKIIIGEL